MTATAATDQRIPRPLRALLVVYFANSFATVGQITIVGKQVFDMTGRELDLGLLGLAEFLPLALLAPFTGSVADRFDRRRVAQFGLLGEMASSLALFAYIATDPTAVWPIFVLVSIFGMARAYATPSARALTMDLAPESIIERITALRSVAFQAGGIVGPIVAGFVFLVDISAPYHVAAGAYAVAATVMFTIPKPPTRKLATRGGRQALRDAAEGLRFIRRQPVVFGAITLDLFAVLLGGIVALLPAIAEDLLGVGAVGLGGLRAAIGAGAATMAIFLSFRPVRRRVGRVLLVAIAVFGVMHLVVGLASSYVIACAAFFVAAAADAVSVYIRATVVPLATPEEMRGRVLAVEHVFIGASNELGAVESGLTAAAFGLVGAIMFGGIGTLAVVAIWWRFFPALRDVDRFAEVRPLE